MSDSATPWSAAHQASLSSTISQSLLKLMYIESWCYLTISSSDTLFSFCLQSFPASGSLLISWLFTSGGQSIWTLASVLPVNSQDYYSLMDCWRGRGWEDLGEWHWNMCNIMYETSCQSRFNAQYWMLGAGALGWPRGMVWGGRRKKGSGWGAHVYLWRIRFDVWQN